MLKAISKNDKVKLRGKKVKKDDIIDIMVELIELGYDGFNIKYSSLMKDVSRAYARKLASDLSKDNVIEPPKRKIDVLDILMVIAIASIVVSCGIAIALQLLGK